MKVANGVAPLLKEAFQIVESEKGDPAGRALTCALEAYDRQDAAQETTQDLEQLVFLLRGVQRSDREIALGTDPEGMFQNAKVGAVTAILRLRQRLSDRHNIPL